MSDIKDRRLLAIAGAWGYIGHKFIEAGLKLGHDVYVYDPGPIPEDVDVKAITRIDSEREFYALNADLFHLALHPEHRKAALDQLLPRAADQNLMILDEKPMAAPEHPEACSELVDAVAASDAELLFDFPELFDPITERIFAYLDSFEDVEVSHVRIQRSKDREDKDNPRNAKKMVPIQYQESVHCIAFLLNLVGRQAGSIELGLAAGVELRATSDPYDAPNPEVYPYVVDGRCDFDMRIGTVDVIGHTDFKRGAPWRKERIIRGTGDGEAFEIQVDYLEGAKYLIINGEDQRCPPWGDSYTAVLDGMHRLKSDVPTDKLMSGVYPNPMFARYAYQLSSATWRASYDGEKITFENADELSRFDARFDEEVPKFPTYVNREG